MSITAIACGLWPVACGLSGLRTLINMSNARTSVNVETAQHRPDIHSRPGLDEYLRHPSRSRRRNLGLHLVGGNFHDRLVGLHPVDVALSPLLYRALGQGHDNLLLVLLDTRGSYTCESI